MATITEGIDISDVSLTDVEDVGYSKEHDYLYVKLSGNNYYFVTTNGNRVVKNEVDQKALDSSEANDKLDQLISDADDD